MHQQQRVQTRVHIPLLIHSATMSASPSTASEMVHVRACIRCMAMACCLPQLLLFLRRHTDEISALHTQPKKFAVSISAYCCRVCVKALEA